MIDTWALPGPLDSRPSFGALNRLEKQPLDDGLQFLNLIYFQREEYSILVAPGARPAPHENCSQPQRSKDSHSSSNSRLPACRVAAGRGWYTGGSASDSSTKATYPRGPPRPARKD
jgi:hypothetical protein